MRRNLHLLSRLAVPAVLLTAAAPALPAAPAATAGQNPPGQNPGSAASPKAHPLLGVPVPESEFVNDPNVGKDPFFPDSTRRLPKTPVLTKVSKTPDTNRAHLLTLRGISGPTSRRLALINNLTFVAGEEGTVRTTAGLLKIRVLQIEDKTVSVLIDGESQPRELQLDDKIPNSIQIQTSQIDK